MADVYAIFGTLLALGIAFPGMLVAGRLLFPSLAERAARRILRTPGRTLGMGLATAIVLAIPITFFLALPFGPAKFVGGTMLLAVLGTSTLGAAGLAGLMARRLMEASGQEGTDWKAFLGAAVALELAAAFPLLGWFLFLPISLLTSLGAVSFALLRWTPGESDEQFDHPEGRLTHEPQSA